MESLIIDKNKLLEKLETIIQYASEIHHDIKNDILLNNIIEAEEVFPESDFTKKKQQTQEKKSLEHIVKEQDDYKKEKTDYADMYDPRSHPDFNI